MDGSLFDMKHTQSLLHGYPTLDIPSTIYGTNHYWVYGILHQIPQKNLIGTELNLDRQQFAARNGSRLNFDPPIGYATAVGSCVLPLLVCPSLYFYVFMNSQSCWSKSICQMVQNCNLFWLDILRSLSAISMALPHFLCLRSCSIPNILLLQLAFFAGTTLIWTSCNRICFHSQWVGIPCCLGQVPLLTYCSLD